ncbi:hypothetical protein BHM03_00012987, partial [Ensete ventricosum]
MERVRRRFHHQKLLRQPYGDGWCRQSRRLGSGSRERDPELSLLGKRADTAPPRCGRYYPTESG